MEAKIALITILTNKVSVMKNFYSEVLGFPIQDDRGQYVEFASEGVRFALCARSVMEQATGYADFSLLRQGQSFELAFPCPSPKAVDDRYAAIVARGATPITAPATMPWGQRAAFFADPEGNIHELFADL